MSNWKQRESGQSSRWISSDFSELLGDSSKWTAVDPESAAGGAKDTGDGAVTPAFDVIIVGSGYGASIAAAELSGGLDADGVPLSVCVLERGLEYLPGSFPSRMADLPGHIRGSFGGRSRGGEGLFDLRIGGDVNVVLANGLGGGSLINAGVMETPKSEVFESPKWPKAWQQGEQRKPWFDEALQLLGAVASDISSHAVGQPVPPPPAKTVALETLASRNHQRFRKAAITVAMQDKTTVAGVQLKACKRCGDCATGCNYGAKESLDTNLLVKAASQGARIYCGATVVRLAPYPVTNSRESLWGLRVVHTDEPLRQRQGESQWLTARHVILAAGSLGSTEILLRSQRESTRLKFSPRLGLGFSTNGDALSFGYDYQTAAPANAVADEDQLPGARDIGPTITGIIDTEAYDDPQARNGLRRLTIEELAVPGALGRVTGELLTTANTIDALDELDWSTHRNGYPANDPYAVHADKIRRTSVFAMMGDDGAEGTLSLSPSEESEGDGHLSVVWPGLKEHPLFKTQARHLAEMAREARFGGRTIPNPLWRLVPPAMDFLIDYAKGPLLTVHPLGGCSIGDRFDSGVVDLYGRVWCKREPDPNNDVNRNEGNKDKRNELEFYPGLHVLDGSIVPTALGTNPALTIAALALQAARHLRKNLTRSRVPAPQAPVGAEVLYRPVLLDVEDEIRRRPPPSTKVGVTERLVGAMKLKDQSGALRDCRISLTLTYEPLEIRHLFRPDAQGKLSSAQLQIPRGGAGGRLEIYLQSDWDRIHAQGLMPDDLAKEKRKHVRRFEISGSLTILRRESSNVLERVARAASAFIRNRGLRDWHQAFGEYLSDHIHGRDSRGLNVAERICGLFKLAAHGGEIRLFEYDLDVGPALSVVDMDSHLGFQVGDAEPLQGTKIQGKKRITYERPSNPWRQLAELHISQFGSRAFSVNPPVFHLDPKYFATQGQPLLRIESQREHTEALADIASLAMYFIRMMLTIHMWNLRKPETPRARSVSRLPGKLPGLPPPDIHLIDVDQVYGIPVQLRLTRYRKHPWTVSPKHPIPVLLIHGYSASGTTFAHPALEPGLAPYLADRDRDVWVADLRSSAGMPFAAYPWSFEQVGLSDIPAAVDFVWRQTGEQPIDIVAHCMGAVMLSMAVLSANQNPEQILRILNSRKPTTNHPIQDRYALERRALPQRIRRVVLSQNGPAMVMSQQNVLRAYVMSYMSQIVGVLPYAFRLEENQGLLIDLADRFLSSLPYPDEELRQENRGWPFGSLDYVGARHRMDALYGRTFSLRNISPKVLDRIDDFFGPLNLDTVAQVIHFAKYKSITTRSGRSAFVSMKNFTDSWTFPTMSLHGAENGLADVATLDRMRQVMQNAGRSFRAERLEGFGHQDSLIGMDSVQVFEKIEDFLAPADADSLAPAAPSTPPTTAYLARPPAIGPMLILLQDSDDHRLPRICLGGSPGLGDAQWLYCAPVTFNGGAGGWAVDQRWIQAHQPNAHATDWFTPVDSRADSNWLEWPTPEWLSNCQADHIACFLLYEKSKPAPAAASSVAIDVAASNIGALAAAVDELFASLNREQSSAGILDLSWRRPEVTPATAGPLTLALGSCQYPPGIVNEYAAYDSWRRLNARLYRASGSAGQGADEPKPELMILAGDQIYSDATAGLFDPSLADDRYRKSYESWLGNEEVRKAMRRLPVATAIDDHEISDNWEPTRWRRVGGAADVATGAAGDSTEARGRGDWRPVERRRTRQDDLVDRNLESRFNGVRGFQRYQRGTVDLPWPGDHVPLWYSFKFRELPFFILDTRTERQLRNATHCTTSTMFWSKDSGDQMKVLKTWLSNCDKDKPKIIVSPSILLPRHRQAVPAQLAFGEPENTDLASLRSDSWDGYPETLYDLLAYIADQQIERVIFLSGDEHIGVYARVTIATTSTGGDDLRPITIHSIHTAGLNTPYRFANARPSDFILEESTQFETKASTTAAAGKPYRLDVQADLIEGAGFTYVSLEPRSNNCSLRLEYDVAPQSAPSHSSSPQRCWTIDI